MSEDFSDDAISQLLKRVSATVAEATPLARPPAGARLPFANAVRTRTSSRRRRSLYGLGVAVAVAVAVPLLALGIFSTNSDLKTLRLPGLTITALAQSQATPQLTAAQATSIATAYLGQDPGNLTFTNYSVTATPVFEPGVTDVAWQCGSFNLPSPQNVWVVEASAPDQQGWTVIRAVVLVDDGSGQATWFGAHYSNATGSGGLAGFARNSSASGARAAGHYLSANGINCQ